MLPRYKRSQSAIEYLMTYGWVILIIILITVELYLSGVFSPLSNVSQSATGFAPFVFLSQECGKAGLVIDLGNPLAYPVKIFNASILSASGLSLGNTGQINYSVRPSQDFSLVFYNSTCNQLGSFYSARVSIYYNSASVFGASVQEAIGSVIGKAAQINEFTFSESGLPQGTQWSVKYAGEIKSSSGSSINFLNVGAQKFSVSNVSIKGVYYYPTIFYGVTSGDSMFVDFIPMRDMFVANGGSATVSAINTLSNEIVANISVNKNPLGVAVTPDGSFVYTTNHGNSFVSIIDTNTNTVVANVTVGVNPFGIAVDFNGSIAYATAAGGGGVLSAINTSNYQVINSLKIGGTPNGIAISPVSGLIYVALSSLNEIAVIDPVTYQTTAIIPVGLDPTSVVMSPDGRLAFSTNNLSDTVSVINASTLKVVKNISVGNGPYSAAVSPNDQILFVSNTVSNNVYVINTSDYSTISKINVGLDPIAITVNPNGQYAYVSNYGSSTISVISTSSDSVVYTITSVKNPDGIADAPSGSV